MSIRNIRKSVLMVAGALVLVAAGLVAGRLAAGVLPAEWSGGSGGRNVFSRIARTLDLTDDQKSRVRAILKSHSGEIETQLTASASARKALQDAMHALPIDEAAIRARAQELGRVRGDGGVLFARLRQEIEPILTSDQQARLQQMRDRMAQRGDRITRAFREFVETEAP
jgi:Spy/CpxP family protein refolding chaperone